MLEDGKCGVPGLAKALQDCFFDQSKAAVTMPRATKFIIAGTQRTGTTLVRTNLSSHPQILCLGEVFMLGKKPYTEPGGYWHFSRQNAANRIRSLLFRSESVASYLDDLFGKSGYRAIGFKLMLSHCNSLRFLWPQLVEHDIRAILIRRRNVLKTLVSRRTAAKSGVYHISNTLRNPTSVRNWKAKAIRLNINTLTADLAQIEAEYADWESKLDGEVDFITVDYEDYVANQGSVNQTIMSFLGTSELPMTSDLKKVNPDSLSEVIENYSDVTKALRNTKFEKLLSQDE